MGILRIFAWLLVGLAVALIGADVITSLEAGTIQIRSTAEIVGLFGLEVERVEGGGLQGLLNFFLAAPLWAVLGVVGIILTLVFRPVS